MKSVDLLPGSHFDIPYLNARSGGGVESNSLAIQKARSDSLPDGLNAILVASDLQGMATSHRYGGESVLLGEVLAETCNDLAEKGVIPDPETTGVILCGDLYSAPAANRRGATGDVRSVWEAFHDSFRWVVGVQGNHDEFGGDRNRGKFFAKLDRACLLDGHIVELDGLTFGGVGLVIGNPDKSGRRGEESYLGLLDKVLKQSPDVLLLHESPRGDRHQRGNAAISDVIVKSAIPVLFCGHNHWENPLAQIGSTAVFNLDARALLIERL